MEEKINLSRRGFIKTLGTAGAAAYASLQPAFAQILQKKTNVLFIISDDLNMGLGCYGNSSVKTPNIDRLAEHGVKFTSAVCQYPLCNPSRTSFLSGLRPETTGIFDLETHPRKSETLKNAVFLPEYFQKNGYFTAGAGKITHGPFEDAISWSIPEIDPQMEMAYIPRVKTKSLTAPFNGSKDIPRWKKWFDGIMIYPSDTKDEEEPDGITATTIANLMKKHRSEPFFLAAGFHKPHVPLCAPKKYFDLYPLSSIKIPEQYEPADHIGKIPKIAFNNIYFPDMPDEQRRQVIQAFCACVSFMDAQTGRLLDMMDTLNLWDNTVVVFISDNGWHLGEHGGLHNKSTLFEESCHLPMIVAAPGKKRGVTCPRPVEYVDIYQTLAELAGLPAPENLEGLSFAPLLADPMRSWKKAVFSQVTRSQNIGMQGRSVRTEQYVYNLWPDGSEELYDIVKDPRQYINSAKDSACQDIMKNMKDILEAGWKKAN